MSSSIGLFRPSNLDSMSHKLRSHQLKSTATTTTTTTTTTTAAAAAAAAATTTTNVRNRMESSRLEGQ